MKRLLSILAALPLMLAACSSDGGEAGPATSSTATSTSSTPSTSSTSSSAAPSSTSATMEPSTVDQAPAAAPVTEAPAAQPTFVACWENGYAQLSDMSVVKWPDCALPPQEAANLGPGPDPATIPYADGGTCPAYKCGYGHDENGNPNPSNSEIQSWWSDCTAANTEEYCRANDPYQ